MNRVLIVDDEPDILLLLRVSLEAQGFATALAADGETALERLEREPFDAMLLDVMMPVMDGWGVLEQLKHQQRESPPVIVVSAKTAATDIVRAIELGATEYVTKPFNVNDLSPLITKVIGWSSDERAHHRAGIIRGLRP